MQYKTLSVMCRGVALGVGIGYGVRVGKGDSWIDPARLHGGNAGGDAADLFDQVNIAFVVFKLGDCAAISGRYHDGCWPG